MARYIWTLIAGFVLGLYSVFFAVTHIKTFRKPVIDMLAKVMVDWIYGERPDELRRGYQRAYAMPERHETWVKTITKETNATGGPERESGGQKGSD